MNRSTKAVAVASLLLAAASFLLMSVSIATAAPANRGEVLLFRDTTHNSATSILHFASSIAPNFTVVTKFNEQGVLLREKGSSGGVIDTTAENPCAGLSLPQHTICEPNYRINLFYTPNDPYYPDSALSQYGTDRGQLTNLTSIGVPHAWDTRTSCGSVTVAVIDSGVRYDHPDLTANMWTNSGEIANNNIDDDNNGYIDDVKGWDFVNGDNDPLDDNGHGTHVSGIIGAVGNNNLGIAGVCHSVKIMPLKFTDASGVGSLSAAISAILYAKAKGVKVMNASWGSTTFSQSLLDAVSDSGAIFVAAAGNAGSNNDTTPNYPANYNQYASNVISVAATTSARDRASFSNYGQTVDVAAPGNNILSTYVSSGSLVYAWLSGTSMAAPHVTGVAALLKAEKSTLTAVEIKALLTSNSTSNSFTHYGLINADEAIQAADSGGGGGGGGGTPTPTPTDTPTPTPTPTQGGGGGVGGRVPTGTPAPLHTVGGTVYLNKLLTGKPLKGVQVVIRDGGARIVGKATSAVDGSYSLTDISEGIFYTIRLTKKGYKFKPAKATGTISADVIKNFSAIKLKVTKVQKRR